MGHSGQIKTVDGHDWFEHDLVSGNFTEEEQVRLIDDLNDLEEKLTVWDRPLHKCVDHLESTVNATIYRRRVGDMRTYYVRHGDTLTCIGAGPRKTTYKRDLRDKIEKRVKDFFDL